MMMSDTKDDEVVRQIEHEDVRAEVVEAFPPKKSIYDVFGTDTAREKSGAVFEYGDIKVRVARAGGANDRFTRLTIQKMQPYRRMLQAQQNKLDANTIALLRTIQTEVFAETVVLGWDGIADREGKDIPFSKVNCLQLLQQLPDFFDQLSGFAQDMSNFQSSVDESDVKN
jgi:hypothetical protein